MTEPHTHVTTAAHHPGLAAQLGLHAATDVVVADAFADVDGPGAAVVRREVAEIRALIAERRPRRSVEDPEISERLYRLSPGLRRWRTFVPSARALEPLYEPTGTLPDGTPIDEAARRFFMHALDGRAVRSRGAVVQWLLEQLAPDGAAQRWVSLACGTARPVCHAARDLLACGTPVDLAVLDWDPFALAMAEDVARIAGVEARVDVAQTNVLDADAVHGVIAPGWATVVESIGFFEYLPTEPTPGALSGAQFLRLAASLVGPGGRLMYANMLTSHPELDFTLHAARWPGIIPRSIEDILAISDEAGLDRAHTDIWLPDSGVTCVVTTTVD